MQTHKSKSNYIEGAQKRSTSESVSSMPHQAARTQKDRNTKINDRRSPKGRVNERCSSKLSDLETSIAQLQEELKKAKDEASSSEFQKREALLEVEEGKRQMSAISAKLEETNEQLTEISTSEDDRLQELCKISQERDRAWEFELEAVRKQHSLDMGALTSAMHEIQQLKKQLEMVTESEAVQTRRAEFAEGEVHKLQFEIGETLTLAEGLKAEARHWRESEVWPQEMLSKTESVLETVSLSADTIQSGNHEVAESIISMEESENRAAAIEPIPEYEEDTNQLKNEIRHLQSEVSELRVALDAAEVRYQEEYIQSTLQIRSAYELVEVAKSETRIREAELEAELLRLKLDMEELQAKQNNQNEKPRLSDKENVWAMELKKARASLADTKARLLEKETLLQAIVEENEKLKLEIRKAETEKSIAIKDAAALIAAEKVHESKVACLTQEAERNSRRVARAMEQLEAAQAANIETEVELRRLKVQCDQWRKAAEAAAVMLTTDSGKYMDRSGSLDGSYHTIGGHLGSPYSDDIDDDVLKKKNGSMLQRIGVLWKKSNSNKQM
ncbi:hypothetical protein QQ045_003999 [Rhodiola kirilowii]